MGLASLRLAELHSARRSSPETINWGVNRTKSEVSLMLTKQRKCPVGSDVKGRRHFPSLARCLLHRSARVKLSKRQAKNTKTEIEKVMSTALEYSREDLSVIVNGTNSFSKYLISEYRTVIRELRQERKERLMLITPSQIGTVIESRGLTLVAQKEKFMKNGTPVVTLVFRGEVSQDDAIRAKIAKLTAQLEKTSLKNCN